MVEPAKPAIRGWLLVLCLMLVIVGPLITAAMMAHDYLSMAPHFASRPGLQPAMLLSALLTAASIAIGMRAGLWLWSIRPGAVEVAKKALLFGLAAAIATATLELAIGPALTEDDALLNQLMLHLMPDLIFFSLCFSYLNRSARVEATYRGAGPQPTPRERPAGAG